jgi:TRAP-type C4-dicarboxylate transport system substrate-binding protein
MSSTNIQEKSVSFIFALTLIILCFCIPLSVSASDKVYNLNFTTAYMDKHPTVQNGFIPWMKEVERLSNGRLKITYFNPNTLAPVNETYNATVSGMIDIGSGFPSQTPGKFPLADAISLPMIAPGAEAGSLLIWDIYQKFPSWQAEYKDVKLLWQWASATFQLHTRPKLVRSIADMKGLRIIGWSPDALEMIKSFGANPLQIGPTDTYLALQRGMADGVMCPLAPVRSYKISDATKYHTIIDISIGAFWAGMNKELWNEMPADLQQIFIDTTGGKLARVCGQTLDAGAKADAEWLKSQGHEFYLVSDSEKEEWFSCIKHMHEKWVKEKEADGLKSARAILDEAVRLGKEYAKITGRGF